MYSKLTAAMIEEQSYGAYLNQCPFKNEVTLGDDISNLYHNIKYKSQLYHKFWSNCTKNYFFQIHKCPEDLQPLSIVNQLFLFRWD